MNAYIVYDLQNLSKISDLSVRNFALKNCLFGATDIGKDNDKSMLIYSGYGKALD